MWEIITEKVIHYLLTILFTLSLLFLQHPQGFSTLSTISAILIHTIHMLYTLIHKKTLLGVRRVKCFFGLIVDRRICFQLNVVERTEIFDLIVDRDVQSRIAI